MVDREQKLLRIGEISAISQVSIKTIRYYEKLGLLCALKRTEGGFRLFSPEVIGRLNFIKRSQSLGLSLTEIGQILQIHDRGEIPCSEVRHTLQTKISEIDGRIKQLKTLKVQLQSLISETKPLQERKSGIICPIIQPEKVIKTIEEQQKSLLEIEG
ncbi:MAG: heavy metal-responsive transcriptional regulator [Prochloraceae cyanobacterium]|nr:heavy metal-responsive transcriptional regulator [Prochloraceae cyanobacterium]